MTVGSDKGKKIDEIDLDWPSKLIVRYHSNRYNPEFTVEAGDKSFHGHNLKLLIEQGSVHMKGWSDLKWEPVISVDTEIYSEICLQYSRMFRSKHKGQNVYRSWKVGDVNEGSFGSRYRDEKQTTADRLDGGEPGDVMNCRERGRILPYTHDRWTQLRKLSIMLTEAMEKTAEKLSELLKQKDIDSFLESSTGLAPLGLSFREKAQKI